MTAREIEAATGLTLKSPRRTGNTLVYLVFNGHRCVGEVWRWYRRGYGGWLTGYRRPDEDRTTRPITGWRASTTRMTASEIVRPDGAPFATRHEAAAALVGFIPSKTQRTRCAS